jgi:hypothetical protein
MVAAAGVPVVVTVNELDASSVKLALAALVIFGATSKLAVTVSGPVITMLDGFALALVTFPVQLEKA